MMFRKRIGSAVSKTSVEDEIDMVDEELETMSSIGESGLSDDTSVVRREKLSKVAATVRNKREDDFVSESSADDKSHDVECTCDICMKTFMHKSTDKIWTCPFCGHKIEVEDDLEEVNELQENPYKEMMDEKRTQESTKRFLKIFNHSSETWQDGRKEQISLELGSEEYGEYIDDLQANNPEKADDSFHTQLETHNEDLVTKAYDDATENPEVHEKRKGESAVDIKKREEMQKRELHGKAVRRAIEAAALTETLTDDQLARMITDDNVVLYNESVKPDEYVEALKDYVVGDNEPSLL